MNIKYLFEVLRRRSIKHLSVPKNHVDVLVFDALHPEIADEICYGMTAYYLDVRNYLYINIKLIFLSLVYILKYGKRGYWFAVLRTISPKVVITTLDQYPNFWWLDINYVNANFLAIQHSNYIFLSNLESVPEQFKLGIFYHPDKIPYYSNLACIGILDQETHEKNGSIVGKYYLVGSIRDSLYRENLTSNNVREYDICLIADSIIDYYAYMPIVTNLKKLMIDRPDLKIAIAMKKNIDAEFYFETKELFVKYLDDSVAIIPRENVYSTYKLSDQSELTISSFSTTLRESFSRKNKILCCNYTGFKEFSINLPDELLTEKEDYEEFKEKVLSALVLSNNDYFNKHGHLIPYYNNHNTEKPTHIAINEIIKELMESN